MAGLAALAGCEVGLLMLLAGSQAGAQAVPGGADAFAVVPVAEARIERLPDGPLFWQVERFATEASAKEKAADTALFVATGGAVWRFTLGARGEGRSGARPLAVIGPVPRPDATRYLLRINRAGGPPGAATLVHTHPGSEAFLVLAGRLCQRTPHGMMRLDAGQSANGHAPGMVMQLRSCGRVRLDQFVLFLVDADKPFSAPAAFPPQGRRR
jgi:hypothetical protein